MYPQTRRRRAECGRGFFHGREEIQISALREPPVPRLVEPLPAVKRSETLSGGTVNAEVSFLRREPQEREPILEARNADRGGERRKIRTATEPNELLSPPPESERIESDKNEPSLRCQHPDRFGKELLRCGREVETVRQNDQIEGFVGKGKRFRQRQDAVPVFTKRLLSLGRFFFEEQPVLPHAVGAQSVEQRQSDLQGPVAQNVLDHPVQKTGFPLSDNLSGRREEKGERFFGLHVA